ALEKYATELNERISRHKQSFLTLFRPDLKKQILASARKIHKALAGIKGKSVKKEFILNQQRFQKILKAPKWKITDVHGLRKQIKIIYHLQKILKPDNTAWQITNEFQERLGAWHDGIVLENGLTKYLESHFLPASEVSSLTKLVKAISIQNEKRFRDILAERKNLVVS
ncbi:MAG TPA: hypothetical protein VJ508_10460, partial [Saprospiraceae bacterium]|nr:hypothetical protein [Saprospiraceae bacterium]